MTIMKPPDAADTGTIVAGPFRLRPIAHKSASAEPRPWVSRKLSRWPVVMLGLCVVSAVATGQTPTVAPQPLTIEGAASYVYKSINQTELRLHVFMPADQGPAPKPAVVFFFGGGWANGNVDQFVPQSKHLSERGLVAIVADYRVFDRHMTSPFEAMADAKSAIRWLRSHAKELHIDPQRIAAAGGSSGGHIALSAGVLEAFDEPAEDKSISSAPNALVLFNPAVDTTTRAERFGPRWMEASPMHHIHRGIPPTVVFHGKADTRVPYAGVERFCTESRKAGNQCQLFGYEGATHGFFNPSRDGGTWYRQTLAEMDRFLTTIGYLSGESHGNKGRPPN